MSSSGPARARTPSVTALIRVLVGIVVIAGGTSAGIAQTKDIRIELSSSAVDANQARRILAMKQYIGEQRGVKITLHVSDAGMSVDKQISDIQIATVKHPDIILIDPVDAVGILPAVKTAQAAGIKLFNIRPAASDPAGLYAGTSGFSFESKYTENMTAWIESLLAAQPKLRLKAGLLYGAAAHTEQLPRADIVKKIAKAHPDRVQVVAEKFAEWSLEIAQNATADFMTAHPDLNLIVAANQQMAMGAANAIASAGKTGTIYIGTYDLDVPTVRAILNGKISFTTGLEFPATGRSLVKAAVEIVQGTYAGTLELPPIYAVSSRNAAEILPKLAP